MEHQGTIELAIEFLQASGYHVAKARKPRKTKADVCMEYIAAQDKLNAVGKPYSPSYDPNYRMKHKPPKYAGGYQNLGGMLYTIPAVTGVPRVWEL